MTTPAVLHQSVPRRIVGRYAIFDAFASGGMASVHLGRLMGPVGFSRTVAIKRLHESFARDPEFVAMFLDEARLVARIRHPNVVPTLDVVAMEHELLLVMEYVTGASLASLLKNVVALGKATPISIVVDILINILNGLHAAHEATNEKGEPLNIVHRDVSPQNVLVGVDGVSRVLDFGVAKAVGRTQHTRAGQVKGKIRYLAPENLAGVEVTRASDIYSASVMLWEALVGKRLFDGETDAHIMHQMVAHHIEPPSRFRPDIPKDLDEIVMRGLRRRPQDRYAKAKAMAMLLESVVPPVTRSAVSAWVVENAGEEIQMREARVMAMEGDVPSVRPPENEASVTNLLAHGSGGDAAERPTIGPGPRRDINDRSTVSPRPLGNASLGSTTRTISATRRMLQRRRVLVASAGLCLIVALVTVMLAIQRRKAEPRKAAQASVTALVAPSAAPVTSIPDRSAAALPTPITDSSSVIVDADEPSPKPSTLAVPAETIHSSAKSAHRPASAASPPRARGTNGTSDRLYQRD